MYEKIKRNENWDAVRKRERTDAHKCGVSGDSWIEKPVKGSKKSCFAQIF